MPFWGAYIWRGLYIEGLIFEISRYTVFCFRIFCKFRNSIFRIFRILEYFVYSAIPPNTVTRCSKRVGHVKRGVPANLTCGFKGIKARDKMVHGLSDSKV